MQYNAGGQITQHAGPEGTAIYGYVPANNGGANQLSGITCTGNLTSQNFSYDTYGNKTASSEIIKGNTYTTNYNYDNYGNVKSVLYPCYSLSGNNPLEIDYWYDGNGYLTGIQDKNTTRFLFTPSAMNSYGQATSYVLGNGKTSTLTTNYGIPTHYYTPGIQDLELSVDFTTGDLSSRTDWVGVNQEVFQYDANDRLRSAKVDNSNEMDFHFADNGNITSKSDVGDYTYDDNKINAVVTVTNPLSNVSNNTQTITYVAYNKTSEIKEGNYDLKYTYGPDFDRRFSELDSPVVSGVVLNKRTYVGNYEINDDQTGNPQQIYYIQSFNGLIAIIVKDNSGTNYYSVYTDQLGSILTVTADDDGATVVAQQNFDAWGRNRNSVDWSYTEASTPDFQSYNYRCPSRVPNWLYRGYTGHEMLPEFGLINMNGRMYDPLLGRMLSPDNGVQEPFSTQAYNRYSYAWNNPFKYNDPTGWDNVCSTNLTSTTGTQNNNFDYGVSAAAANYFLGYNAAVAPGVDPSYGPGLWGFGEQLNGSLLMSVPFDNNGYNGPILLTVDNLFQPPSTMPVTSDDGVDFMNPVTINHISSTSDNEDKWTGTVTFEDPPPPPSLSQDPYLGSGNYLAGTLWMLNAAWQNITYEEPHYTLVGNQRVRMDVGTLPLLNWIDGARLAGTLGKYSDLSKLTSGFKGEIQAHHLIEQRFLNMFGWNADEVPSVILAKGDHQATTNILRMATKYGEDATFATKEEVLKYYNDLYGLFPEWQKEIKNFIKNH